VLLLYINEQKYLESSDISSNDFCGAVVILYEVSMLSMVGSSKTYQSHDLFEKPD